MNQIKGRIVIVDDDIEMRSLIRDFLVNCKYEVICFGLATDALEALAPGGKLNSEINSGEIDLILSDLRMPEMDGLDFTTRVRQLRPEIPVILVTAFGSIETAIEAIRRGAFHYIVKPFKLVELSVHVERALEHRRLQRDNITLRDQVKRDWTLGNIIGKSPAMKAVFDLITRVSRATSNVLITGESGSGKEMIAKAIHESGPRAGKPFVAINCTAIPENLLESELFGHARGSFTGAMQRKRGLIEEADGGTLFLDEIGDMNVVLQSKLLRVLQDRRVRAVGDNVSKIVDVRIISATHKNLRAAIRDGCFREDLYYRLSVIPISVPPLRQRQSDIPLLAEHFLRKYSAMNNLHVRGVTKEALAKLVNLRWEGNVRELENVIERAVVLCRGHWIECSDIPSPDLENVGTFFTNATTDFPTINQLEERYIRLVLEKTGGRKDNAAQILGINRRTLYRKEREYDLVPSHHFEPMEHIEHIGSEEGHQEHIQGSA